MDGPTAPKAPRYAIAELTRGQLVAGAVRVHSIAGREFLRFETPGNPNDYRYVNPASIRVLTPCDEAAAREAAGVALIATEPEPPPY